MSPGVYSVIVYTLDIISIGRSVRFGITAYNWCGTKIALFVNIRLLYHVQQDDFVEFDNIFFISIGLVWVDNMNEIIDFSFTTIIVYQNIFSVGSRKENKID